VATGIRKSNITGFPAVRAIVQAVHAQADVFQTFANGAVFFAGALVLRLVALTAKYRTDGHCSLLKETLPELPALRQVADFSLEADKAMDTPERFREQWFFDASWSTC
jgi:hypothetical protein